MAREKSETVAALQEISERGLRGGRAVHIHAARGELGDVVGPGHDPGWVNVTWRRSGTTTICHVDEILRLR